MREDATILDSRRAKPWAAVAWHGFLLLGGAVLVAKVAPVFADLFEEYGRELPFLTQLLIGLADSFLRQWPAYLGFAFIFLAADVAVLHALRQHASLSVYRIWSFSVTGVILLCYLLIALALYVGLRGA